MKYLEQVSRGDVQPSFDLAPPGSAKSTVASVLFPVFFLAQAPGSANYHLQPHRDLAERFGRRVRNLINEHSAVLGLQLSEDIQAAGSWNLKSGGRCSRSERLGPCWKASRLRDSGRHFQIDGRRLLGKYPTGHQRLVLRRGVTSITSRRPSCRNRYQVPPSGTVCRAGGQRPLQSYQAHGHRRGGG